MTTKTIANPTSTPADSPRRWLRAQLAAFLPGLTDGDLNSLAVLAHDELEERVGAAVSDRLNDSQLAEFSRLIDEGIEPGPEWLHKNVPGCSAIVAAQRARLVAEIVDVVTGTDPGSATGHRSVDELITVTMDVVEEHFISRELKYRHQDDRIVVGFVGDETSPRIMAEIRLRGEGDAQLLTFTGGAPDATVSAESLSALIDFTVEWNTTKWLPKALICPHEGSEMFNLVGEIAIPVLVPITLVHLDRLVTTSISRLLGLFASARECSLL